MTAVPREFFARSSIEVGRDLLGCTLWCGDVGVRLTEVEAYSGAADPASHAFRGSTRRNVVMFGPPGYAYVYFIYGMHWCLNLVCDVPGVAAAVLLRAGQVVHGVETARTRRGSSQRDSDLARGPARLAKTLGLSGSDNGRDLCSDSATLYVCRGVSIPLADIDIGPRVGVVAGKDQPWRMWIKGDPTVSSYRSGGRSRVFFPRKGG